MLFYTDPTYLRAIVDGLAFGKLQKDNVAAIPHGLVDIFEGFLLAEQSVKHRNRVLEFFTAWAMLKKEVSIQVFLTVLIGWNEDQVLKCVSIYSKWFNSPQSGFYLLYHERLRSFLLQKSSEQDFMRINYKIISCCKEALREGKADEWEMYALEHLSTHLLIQGMRGGEFGMELKFLASNKNHWNRQIEFSKGFEWSKKMLYENLQLAARDGDEELAECGLNRIELYQIEQNDATSILELLAQRDTSTVLQRIENFGSESEEGLIRKFNIYMLCLIELADIYSNDSLLHTDEIKILIKHLDENLPDYISMSVWGGDGVNAYLVYKIAFKCGEMDLDCSAIYKRILKWDSSWLGNIDLNIKEHRDCILKIQNDYFEYWLDKDNISKYPHVNGYKTEFSRIETIIKCFKQDTEGLMNWIDWFLAKVIKYERSITNKCETILFLSNELVKRKCIEKSNKLLSTVYGLIENLNNIDHTRCVIQSQIATTEYLHGNIGASEILIQEVIDAINDGNGKHWKPTSRPAALLHLVKELVKQNKNTNAELLITEIKVNPWKRSAEKFLHDNKFENQKKDLNIIINKNEINLAINNLRSTLKPLKPGGNFKNDFLFQNTFKGLMSEIIEGNNIELALKIASNIELDIDVAEKIYLDAAHFFLKVNSYNVVCSMFDALHETEHIAWSVPDNEYLSTDFNVILRDVGYHIKELLWEIIVDYFFNNSMSSELNSFMNNSQYVMNDNESTFYCEKLIQSRKYNELKLVVQNMPLANNLKLWGMLASESVVNNEISFYSDIIYNMQKHILKMKSVHNQKSYFKDVLDALIKSRDFYRINKVSMLQEFKFIEITSEYFIKGLVLNGNVNAAINRANLIDDAKKRDFMFTRIIELSIDSMALSESIDLFQHIQSTWYKDWASEFIYNKIESAEMLNFMISNHFKADHIIELGKRIYRNFGLEVSLDWIKKMQLIDAKEAFLAGLLGEVKPNECSNSFLKLILPEVQTEMGLYNLLVYKFSVNQLLYSELLNNKKNRLMSIFQLEWIEEFEIV
jgi:hypothetical protein